jgi:soluble lytic murein transglycosylase-like protein
MPPTKTAITNAKYKKVLKLTSNVPICHNVKVDSIDSIQSVMQRIREISQLTQEVEKGSSENLKQLVDKPEFAKELDIALGINSPNRNLNPNNTQTTELTKKIEPIRDTEFSEIPKLKHRKPHTINEIIQAEAKAKGLDPDLVKAVVKAESNFNPRAESPKGAMGLMQLMPDTAEELGVENPFDPVQNIKGGTKYLKELLDTFKNKDLAVAAYNAGPGAVRKYKGIPPYSETKGYVKKVNAYLNEYR